MKSGHLARLLLIGFVLLPQLSFAARGLENLTRDYAKDIEGELDATYYAPLSENDRLAGFEVFQSYQGSGGPSLTHPRLVMTAGAMASGKTSVFNALVRHGIYDPSQVVLIDPDINKKLLFEKYRLANPSGTKTLSDFHLLSMYVGDLVLGACIRQNKTTIYMTSLRHRPSGDILIQRMRSQYPQYRLGIIFTRAPFESLVPRADYRYRIEGRRTPPHLVLQSAEEVDDSIYHLEQKVDQFMIVTNDDNRPPYITYLRRGSDARGTSISLNPQPAELEVRDRRELQDFFEDSELSFHAGTPHRFHVIFDIDWTILYALHPAQVPSVQTDPFISYRSDHYRWADGTAEAFQWLLNQPDVLLSVASGGYQERNEFVLRNRTLPDGSNAFQRVYRVLSKQHLRIVGSSGPRFSDKNKKDLARISREYATDSMILVDDVLNFAFQDPNLAIDQSPNFLWLGRTFNFLRHFPGDLKIPFNDSKWNPNTATAWVLERAKMAWVVGVLDASLKLSRKTGMSLKEAHTQVTRGKDGKRIDRENKDDSLQHYRRGFEILSSINKNWFSLPHILSGREPDCWPSLVQLWAPKAGSEPWPAEH